MGTIEELSTYQLPTLPVLCEPTMAAIRRSVIVEISSAAAREVYGTLVCCDRPTKMRRGSRYRKMPKPTETVGNNMAKECRMSGHEIRREMNTK